MIVRKSSEKCWWSFCCSWCRLQSQFKQNLMEPRICFCLFRAFPKFRPSHRDFFLFSFKWYINQTFFNSFDKVCIPKATHATMYFSRKTCCFCQEGVQYCSLPTLSKDVLRAMQPNVETKEIPLHEGDGITCYLACQTLRFTTMSSLIVLQNLNWTVING